MFQNFNLIIDTATKLKSSMLKHKKRYVWTVCPSCQQKLYGRLCGKKDHLYMACENKKCEMRLIE